ncbi:thioesterase domain-containing protein [Flavitalea sp. BT771]|uniref:thioesterase II family protein n=1 Tax=Flavitalea sp. BT771 TaxID=3063329 RepID=UPI0026E12B1B|nr:alpha/beta fold hydrolase [Flavitalea sp. BT771]MDO6435736.1 thioesterase domain-containing protein [Flavitalea sp. BT771]MDV6224637.1 thioesterase domain-containing protein [Flavitalea sp. BT771]
MQKIDLFCLPFGGGNKHSYRRYIENAPPFLNVVTFDYPGRGARIGEPFAQDIDMLVSDLYRQFETLFNRKAYAIYGHSMGALLGYLLTKKIIERGHVSPAHLFFTGTTGPSAVSRRGKKRHLLGRKEFIEEVMNLDEFENQALENEEFVNYFEPILRADFRIIENYVYKESDPLDIPLTVITGTQEDLEPEEIRLWKKETKCAVKFMQLPGKHFFIFHYSRDIMRIISNELSTKHIPYYHG